MPDTGCNTQSLVDSSFVRRNKLERIPIVPREIKAYDDRPGEKVQAVVRYEIDIGAHKSMVWAYEVERMKDQEIILGLPWLQKNSVAIEPEGPQLFFQRTGHRVSSIYATDIDLAAYKMWASSRWRKKGIQVFAASLADIEKKCSSRRITQTQGPNFLLNIINTWTCSTARQLMRCPHSVAKGLIMILS